MAVYNDYLIVSHYDISEETNDGISFYNLSTKELKYYELNHRAQQISVSGGNLYILSWQDVYKYRITDMSLELMDTLTIEKSGETQFLSEIFTLQD